MIAAPQALTNLIASRQFTRVDLYAITPKGLATLYWTSADIAVTWNGALYQPTGMLVKRGNSKLLVGLETDTLELKLYPGAAETQINGVPLRQAVQRGILDGADISLTWAYVSGWGPPPQVVATILRFIGNAGTVVVGQDCIDITVNSPLKRLDVPVPTKVYGPSCRWTLGDGGCGVNLAAYGQTVTVGAGSTDKLIVATLPDTAQGWAGGKIDLSTGLDTGVRRTIASYGNGVITLATPLPWAPAAGDAVTVTPGCDKVLPQVANTSASFTIPASLQIAPPSWSGDLGVQAGVPASTAWIYYDSSGQQHVIDAATAQWGEWWGNTARIININGERLLATQTTLPAALTAMTAVGGAPVGGCYGVANGVYRFAAADVGKTVQIAWSQWVGGGRSCAIYGNIARFGGQPFIPAPETAY